MTLFYIYETVFNRRGKSRDGSKKIKSHLAIEKLSETCYALRHHNTYIVKVHENGSVILDHGGWKSATTKKFMNVYALKDLDLYLYQEDFEWYLRDKNGVVHNYYNGLDVNTLDCVILPTVA